MATNCSLQFHPPLRRQSTDCCHPSTISSSSLFLKPNSSFITTNSLSSKTIITFSLSSTTSSSSSPTTTSQPTTSFDLLRHHLSSQNFREADEETRRLLIVLAGEAALLRGYVFFSEVQFISESDLKTIDELWRQHSDNKFGYSVQKKVWKKMNKDFTKFFIKVGWMKKLESSEVEQFNYRAFPNEFFWGLTYTTENDENTPTRTPTPTPTPEGHLPLTNALRGSQLLNSILNHPAFEEQDEEEEVEQVEEGRGDRRGGFAKPLGEIDLKPDYSF